MPNNQSQPKNNTSIADTDNIDGNDTDINNLDTDNLDTDNLNIDNTDTNNTIDTNQVHENKMVRMLYIIAGVVFLLLGIIGAFLPVMPTTGFVILSAYCWAKGSERFHTWLINHRFFGKILRDWYEHRAMPRKAKYLAWSMMTLSCAFLWYQLPERLWWLALLTSVVCLATSIWMARLPDAQ